ncbi:MAG: hypothetical protein J1E41_07530, partial [Ruminococcus sp.]|nr:hypothetical protein [Ruminococcus sp.]
MKKAITISLFAIFIVSFIIPVGAFTPLQPNEQVEYIFREYYTLNTNGEKAEKIICTEMYNCPGSKFGNEYYLIRFISKNVLKQTYFNRFGNNNEFYESSEITNRLFPSGIVVFIGNPYDDEYKDNFLSLAEIAKSNPDAIDYISEQIGTEYVGRSEDTNSMDSYSTQPKETVKKPTAKSANTMKVT